jgi:hypothetical protein
VDVVWLILVFENLALFRDALERCGGNAKPLKCNVLGQVLMRTDGKDQAVCELRTAREISQ